MAKIFELAFQIGGKLGSSFSGALSGASGALTALGRRAKELERGQADVSRFRVLKMDAQDTAKKLQEAQGECARLGRAMRETERPSKALARDFEAAKRKAGDLKERLGGQNQELHRLRSSLQAAGASTSNLAGHQNRLAKAAESARAAQGRLQSTMARIQANQARRERMGGAMMSGMGGNLIGGLAAGFAADRLMTPGIDLEHLMAMGGNIANMTRSQIASTTAAIRSASLESNQAVMDMANAWQNLLAKGMENDQAVAALGTLGRVATATGSSMEDLSNTAFSLMDNLKIGADQLPQVMDILAQAGKAGSFELRDMAKFFPQLTAGFRSLGIEGPQAAASLGAALQIAMKGAANPDEAATNMKNFLAKMTAPDTIKNFSEHYGINLEKALKKAMARGENPVEFMLKLIQRVTGGDQFRIGELFGDMQVNNFLKPMMANMEEFKKIREEAMGASGVVDKDFARMMETSKEKLKGMESSARDLAITLGGTLTGSLGSVLGGARPVLDWANSLAKRFPVLTGAVITGVAGFAALGLASATLGYVWTFMAGGWLNLLKLFQLGGAAIALLRTSTIGLTAVQLASAAGAKVWAAAQWLLNAAFWANPITWVVAGAVALGAAAWWVVSNWDTVKAFFSGLWEHIAAGVAPAVEAVRTAFSGIMEWFGGLSLAESGAKLIMTFVDGITSKAAAAWESVQGVLQGIRDMLPFSDAKVGPLSALTASGRAIIETMASGLASIGGGPLAHALGLALGQARDTAGEGVDLPVSAGAGQAGGALRGAAAGGITINFAPVITVQGSAVPGALDASLRESEERLREMVERILSGERRIAYA